MDTFSRIDESKKFCEISFHECTKFYRYNEKMQEITLCEDRSTVHKNSRQNFHELKILKRSWDKN